MFFLHHYIIYRKYTGGSVWNTNSNRNFTRTRELRRGLDIKLNILNADYFKHLFIQFFEARIISLQTRFLLKYAGTVNPPLNWSLKSRYIWKSDYIQSLNVKCTLLILYPIIVMWLAVLRNEFSRQKKKIYVMYVVIP